MTDKNEIYAVLIEVTHHESGVEVGNNLLTLHDSGDVEQEVYTKNDFEEPQEKHFQDFVQKALSSKRQDLSIGKNDSAKVTFLTIEKTINYSEEAND
ncbi:hypothetical protein OQI89_10665 [Lentilactobacillus diolivorans]|uniref:hypothetical protein n=1 Tax=Lentilactobacillus diolivorans TaxID=179838 RepID=UPI0024686F3F|nr:hypothetical protein [Lentilactobacillus diolivorans]MDH5106313.1 hypothetical protein [Lentilactobacillus diolivorans]